MIHSLFNRPHGDIKIFFPNGTLWQDFKAAGDAWGLTPDNIYGHDSWCPPGHFLLGTPQYFDPPINSEGYGQIPVRDIDAATLALLVDAGKAQADGTNATIGGITLPIGQLAKYDRSAIMIHGGGSNSPNPLADNQGLYRTNGCTRMLNGDWKRFAAYLSSSEPGNLVIYSIIGDPLRLAS